METLTEDRSRPAEAVRPADGTGQRVSLRRLFWIFFIASFLGANIETAFMLLTRGELQNRSGVLFGTFSLVWGFGAVLFTLCFRRFQGRGGVRVLLGGALVGAGYEYLCSWLQEVLFGACFWDYSHLPFNLHGRVCLVFSLLWGGGRPGVGAADLPLAAALDRPHPRPDGRPPHPGAGCVYGGQHRSHRRRPGSDG